MDANRREARNLARAAADAKTIARLQQQLYEKELRETSQNAAHNDATRQVRDLEMKLEEAKRTYEQQIQAGGPRFEASKDELAHVRAELEASQVRGQVLSTELATARNEIASMKTARSAVNGQYDASIHDLRSQLEESERRRESAELSLRLKNEELKKCKTDLSEARSFLTNEITTLQQRLAEREKMQLSSPGKDALTSALREAELKNAELHRDLSLRREEASQYKQETVRQATTIVELKRDLARSRREAEGAQMQSLQDKESNSQKHSQLLISAEARAHQVEGDLVSSRIQLATANKALSEKEEEIRQLERELAQLHSTLGAAETKIHALDQALSSPNSLLRRNPEQEARIAQLEEKLALAISNQVASDKQREELKVDYEARLAALDTQLRQSQSRPAASHQMAPARRSPESSVRPSVGNYGPRLAPGPIQPVRDPAFAPHEQQYSGAPKAVAGSSVDITQGQDMRNAQPLSRRPSTAPYNTKVISSRPLLPSDTGDGQPYVVASSSTNVVHQPIDRRASATTPAADVSRRVSSDGRPYSNSSVQYSRASSVEPVSRSRDKDDREIRRRHSSSRTGILRSDERRGGERRSMWAQNVHWNPRDDERRRDYDSDSDDNAVLYQTQGPRPSRQAVPRLDISKLDSGANQRDSTNSIHLVKETRPRDEKEKRKKDKKDKKEKKEKKKKKKRREDV